MNEAHLRICSSPEWQAVVEEEILPNALGDRSLGEVVLEVGAGPGLTTDSIRQMVPNLTAVELDEELAAKLAERLADTNVEVVCADASRLPFEDNLFSSALMFTMLHHVPTATLQDCVFKELCRVLRPGGLLVGSDSIDTSARRELHKGDIYNPVDPETIPERLREAGYVDISLEGAHKELYEERFYFWARAPKA
jgi:ubiquinone/menaquinone biosynthesis C-methylase UbiE